MIMMLTDPLWARLPVGGWQVGFRLDSCGRTVIDVADPWGTVAYRVTVARRQAPSVDVACAGRARGRGQASLCWALAVGHAPAEDGRTVSVTFTGPQAGAGAAPGGDGPPPGQGPSAGIRSEFRLTGDGLWVAAASGRYTHVRLATRSATVLQALRPVTETVAETVAKPGLETWTRAPGWPAGVRLPAGRR